MKFRHAKKLHTGDEVTVKSTKEVVKVVKVVNKMELEGCIRPTMHLQTVDKDNYYSEYVHTQVI